MAATVQAEVTVADGCSSWLATIRASLKVTLSCSPWIVSDVGPANFFPAATTTPPRRTSRRAETWRTLLVFASGKDQPACSGQSQHVAWWM